MPCGGHGRLYRSQVLKNLKFVCNIHVAWCILCINLFSSSFRIAFTELQLGNLFPCSAAPTASSTDMTELGSRTRMELAAAPINADPIGLGAGLMALVTGVTVLILAVLRGRKVRALQVLALVSAILGIAGTTTLFVLTLQTARSFVLNDNRLLEAMAFNSETGTWTLVREVRSRTWSLVTAFSLASLYLYCLMVVLVTPATTRVAVTKRTPAAFNDEDPLSSSSSADREQDHRFDFNRVWVNFIAVIVGIAIVTAFGGAVASTRQSVRVGENVPTAVVSRTTTARLPENTEPLQKCVCEHTKCEGQPDRIACRSILQAPWHSDQMWECLTNVKNATEVQRRSIVRAIDRCVKRETVTTGSSIGMLLVSAAGSVVLGVFTGSGRPLIYTASFLLVAYFAICTILFSVLPLLVAFLDGPINTTYGVSREVVYLSVVTGPAGVRMFRVCMISLFVQLGIMMLAATTEVGKYSWQHTFYDLFAIKRNNDDLDPETYYGYRPDDE